MNLNEIHTKKEVSAKSISGSVQANITAIQILKNGLLKEHITKDPALLLCVLGALEYNDEKETKVTLRSGDFYEINPRIKHWVKGIETSQLVLIK